MKRILVVLALVFPLMLVAGNGVFVFQSFDDYKANKGQKYDFFKGMSSSLGKYRIEVRKAGKIEKIKCEDIWGFKVEEDLYRTTASGLYLKLASQGKLFYFENGEAYLGDGMFVRGHYNYLSTSVGGELTPVATADVGAAVRAEFQKFKEAHPEFISFFNCFETNPDLENCRDCLDRFENPNRVRIFDGYKEP